MVADAVGLAWYLARSCMYRRGISIVDASVVASEPWL